MLPPSGESQVYKSQLSVKMRAKIHLFSETCEAVLFSVYKYNLFLKELKS